MDRKAFLQYMTNMSQMEHVSVEDFVRMMFEHEPTGETWTHDLWHSILPTLRDKVPEREFVISVAEAARLKDCTTGVIRNAIARGELVAQKVGNRWCIDPTSLHQWQVDGSIKTPTYDVSMYFGRNDKAYFGLRVDGLKVPFAQQLDEQTFQSHIYEWSSIGLYTHTKYGARFFRLIPAPVTKTLRFAEFYVQGYFKVEHIIRKYKKATRAWQEYRME